MKVSCKRWLPKMLPYGRHNIDQNDIDAVVDVLKGDWLTCGPIVELFEEKLSKITHSPFAVSCSNGTTALHLALLALEVGVGDAVLVPAVTFLASANAVRYVGADVVFVDVDPSTGLMTAATLKNAIEQNQNLSLKAVINVHLAGQCSDLKDIYDVARSYNLFIIEDAAHAIGTMYRPQDGEVYPIGSNQYSDLTTFSFHPVKTIAMGEGGAITSKDATIVQKLKSLRSHGMSKDSEKWVNTEDEKGPWYYEMKDLGYNYRISDISCALGISQLEKLVQFKGERSTMVSRYDSLFANASHMQPLHKHSYSDTAWHLYVLLIDFKSLEISRKDLMEKLKEKGFGTQVHYIPLYKQPYYKKLYGAITLEGAEEYYAKCLSIPLYVGLTQTQQENITQEILSLCQAR